MKLFINNLCRISYRVIVDEILGPYMRVFNEGNCRLLQDNAPTDVTDLIHDALTASLPQFSF